MPGSVHPRIVAPEMDRVFGGDLQLRQEAGRDISKDVASALVSGPAAIELVPVKSSYVIEL